MFIVSGQLKHPEITRLRGINKIGGGNDHPISDRIILFADLALQTKLRPSCAVMPACVGDVSHAVGDPEVNRLRVDDLHRDAALQRGAQRDRS